MRVFLVEDRLKAVFKDVPTPKLKPNEILCRVCYNGICGTDLAIYSGETNFVKDGYIKYPVRIGHEWSGVVEDIGGAVTRFKKGDRVVSDNSVGCLECDACKRGKYNDCKNLRSLGTINCWDGAYAEYLVMPEVHLHHLPKEIGMAEAALLEPLTVAYSGYLNYKIDKNTRVAVIGTGPIGMSAAAMAKTLGAEQIIVTGRQDFKLDIAKKMGATHTVNIKKEDYEEAVKRYTNGLGADLVIETSGAASAVQQAIDIASTRAHVCLLGFFEDEINGLQFNRAVSKELKMIGVLGGGNVEQIIRFVIDNKIDLKPMITGTIEFEELKDFFEKHEKLKAENVKVLVRIGRE